MESDFMANKIENLDINIIKNKIEKLFNNKEIIHVSVNMKRKNVKNVEAIILGVYNNFFTVRSKINFYEEDFTISYIDLLIKNISIKELE